jgi:hypothetical protein
LRHAESLSIRSSSRSCIIFRTASLVNSESYRRFLGDVFPFEVLGQFTSKDSASSSVNSTSSTPVSFKSFPCHLVSEVQRTDFFFYPIFANLACE